MDIQTIIFELNLRKEQWLVVSVYEPPAQMQLTFLSGYLKLLTFIVLSMRSKL